MLRRKECLLSLLLADAGGRRIDVKMTGEIKAKQIENPIESLKNTIPFSSMDWSTEKRNAWVYGIVCGWDDDCFSEFNKRFHWDKDTWDRLKRLHDLFNRLEAICAAERDGRC